MGWPLRFKRRTVQGHGFARQLFGVLGEHLRHRCRDCSTVRSAQRQPGGIFASLLISATSDPVKRNHSPQPRRVAYWRCNAASRLRGATAAIATATCGRCPARKSSLTRDHGLRLNPIL